MRLDAAVIAATLPKCRRDRDLAEELDAGAGEPLGQQRLDHLLDDRFTAFHGLSGNVHVGHRADKTLSLVCGFDLGTQFVGPLFKLGNSDAIGIEYIRIESESNVDFFFQINPFLINKNLSATLK